MAVRRFVGNLPYDVTEAELRAHFAAIGPLAYLSLAMDRDTGKPRGFAFVEFSARADAEDAMRRLHNHLFKGRPLAVTEARAGRACAAECSTPRGPAPTERGGPEPGGGPGLRPRCGAAAPAAAGEAGRACRARPEAPHLQARARTGTFQRRRRGRGRGGGARRIRCAAPRRRGRARPRVAHWQ